MLYDRQLQDLVNRWVQPGSFGVDYKCFHKLQLQKTGLQMQAGCGIIMPRGTPTNGYLPVMLSKLLRPPLGNCGTE